MATFLYRTGSYFGVRWDTTPAGFADAGALSGEQLEAVTALANANVARGREEAGQRVFDPNGVVTRGQMAAFLNRLQALMDSSVGGFASVFDDDEDPDETLLVTFDDDAGVFQRDIRAIASLGIAQGVGDGSSYRPGQAVTRSQMARFLARVLSFDQLYRSLFDGYPLSPFRAENETGDVAPRTEQVVGLDGTTTYTFTGLPGTGYRLALLPSFVPSRIDGGWEFFTDAADGAVDEDLFAVATRLEQVDGAPPPQDGVLAPEGGRLTLTLRTGGVEEVVLPVLHRGGPTAGIDLPEAEPDPDFPDDPFRFGRPVDEIVVGGPTVATAPLLADGGSVSGAPAGGRSTADVVAVQRADGSQVRVTYDRGDSFTVDGQAVTLGQFERAFLFSTFPYVVGGDEDGGGAEPPPPSPVLSVSGFSVDRSGTTVLDLVTGESDPGKSGARGPTSSPAAVAGERRLADLRAR